MEQYKLTEASRPNWWRCEDTANGIVQEWANKDYNGSQETQISEEGQRKYFATQHPEKAIARDLRQLCDWLQEHHREKLI